MITYLYRCPKCGDEQEVKHSIKVEMIVKCDCCNSEMKHVISGGLGFFVEKIGTIARHHAEGKEKSKARKDFLKKHPYDEIPNSLE